MSKNNFVFTREKYLELLYSRKSAIAPLIKKKQPNEKPKKKCGAKSKEERADIQITNYKIKMWLK